MADSTKEAGAPRGDRLALAHPAAPRPALRPDALLHVGVGQVLAVDDHVGVVGGLQGEAAVADAAAVTLLFVHVHDVLQVLLPAAEGELRTGTRLTPALPRTGCRDAGGAQHPRACGGALWGGPQLRLGPLQALASPPPACLPVPCPRPWALTGAWPVCTCTGDPHSAVDCTLPGSDHCPQLGYPWEHHPPELGSFLVCVGRPRERATGLRGRGGDASPPGQLHGRAGTSQETGSEGVDK